MFPDLFIYVKLIRKKPDIIEHPLKRAFHFQGYVKIAAIPDLKTYS